MYSSHYHTLGVTPTATSSEIRKAYKLKAKALHPDINKSPEANIEFIKLKEAFEVLMDPNQRLIYDNISPNEENFRNVGQYVKGAKKFRYMPNYEQWIEIKKQKIKEQQEKEKSIFEAKRSKLKNSPFYTWFKLIFYSKIYGLYVLAVSIMIVGWYIVYKTHFVIGFLLSPIFCLAILIAIWAFKTHHKEIKLFE